MEENRGNLHISGSGSIEGGTYGEIGVSGSASAQADISCERLRVSGGGRFSGALTCLGEARVSGSASVGGELRTGVLHVSGSLSAARSVFAGSLHVSGSLKAAGDVEADEAHISGGCKVQGALRGRAIRLSGGLSVENGVECEELDMSGGFTANGLMNAESVRIRIGGRCKADEIGGESIDVRKSDMENVAGLRILNAIISSFTPERFLEANAIEGTQIYLENTRCGAVRGRRVEIGPGCNIRRVEYSESLTIDPASEVSEQIKTEA